MAKVGRPTKYDPEFINKADDYLELHTDEETEQEKKEGWVTYGVKVKLPTIDGFARYIGVVKSTMYDWAKDHPEFSNALESIRVEQKERLINMGLAGDYNSTITKLILSSNHGMAERKDITTKGKELPQPLLDVS